MRDQGLLESAWSRAVNKHGYGTSNLHELAAAYAFGIAKNHAFHDGNKRAAWASAVAFLALNGVDVDVEIGPAFEAVVGLATGTLSEDAFAAWLRSITRVAMPATVPP